MNILTDVDWENVQMSPMFGSGYPPAIRNKEQVAKGKFATIVGIKTVKVLLNFFMLIAGVIIIIAGGKIFTGSLPAPGFSYEQMMGLIFIAIGLWVMKVKIVRRGH